LLSDCRGATKAIQPQDYLKNYKVDVTSSHPPNSAAWEWFSKLTGNLCEKLFLFSLHQTILFDSFHQKRKKTAPAVFSVVPNLK